VILKKYSKPVIDILLFDDEEVCTNASGAVNSDYVTSAQDLTNQAQNYMRSVNGSGSLSVIRLEDINVSSQ
jgi:hypothetical protein